MFVEIHVASNFVASLLYNRLPRRRVNIFSEELEKALKDKFVGHWYPEMPEKGSGFRCIKVGRRLFNPPDAILTQAAVESGTPINEILEHLPEELTLWIDPGEVSYKVGERKPVKVLYSGNVEGVNHHHNANNNSHNNLNDHHLYFSGGSSDSSDDGGDSGSKLLLINTTDGGSSSSTFSDFDECSSTGSVGNNNNNNNNNNNAEGGSSLKTLSTDDVTSLLSTITVTTANTVTTAATPPGFGVGNTSPVISSSKFGGFGSRNGSASKLIAASPTSVGGNVTAVVGSTNVQPMTFVTRCNTPTFTTASFAQTKFGSTKLKTNSKRTNRMSPTEFSNYIKQRAQMQQQMNRNHSLSPMMSPRPLSPQMIRSYGDNFFFPNGTAAAAVVGNGGGSSPINGFRECDTLFDSNNLANIVPPSSDAFAANNKYSFLDDSFFNQSSSSLTDSLSPIGTPPAAGAMSPLGADTVGDASSSSGAAGSAAKHRVFQSQELDFLDNLNLAANTSAANSYTNPYQHLLLAS